MTFETFADSLAEAVGGLDTTTLTPETALKDIPQWDSLAVLTVISMCDMEYGVTLGAADIRACLTLSDLYSRVEDHAG